MDYNLEPRTIKENLLGLIGKNPHAEPRPANTREECFLADIAENGGGGGGLPPYTSADKGKGLFLVDDAEHTETVVIVPEQTVTVESGLVPLVGADASGFVVGNTGVMTVNGTDYNVTAVDDEGAITYGGEEIGAVVTYLNGTILFGGNPGTYTVSLTASIPSVEPKWEAPSGGDALIVKATGEATLDNGTITVEADVALADMIAALMPETAKPICILFPRMAINDLPGYYTYEDGAVASVCNFYAGPNGARFNDPFNDSYAYGFGYNSVSQKFTFTYDGR